MIPLTPSPSPPRGEGSTFPRWRVGLRHGMTLIEVLVVFAIVAVLMAMLVSGVHHVRIAAEKSQCQNNLRQIGLALHQFHDTYGCFPPAMRNGPFYGPTGSLSNLPDFPWLSWRGYLLAYPSPDMWNAIHEAYAQEMSPFHNPPHVGLATPVEVYLCPSDGRDPITVQEAGPKGPPYTTAALTSYLGVSGQDLKSRDGVFLADGSIKLRASATARPTRSRSGSGHGRCHGSSAGGTPPQASSCPTSRARLRKT